MQHLISKKGSFSLLSISRNGVEDGQAQCCQNCERVILNFAEISDGQNTYIVGTECAKTLCNEEGRKTAKGFELWQKRMAFYTDQDPAIIFRKSRRAPDHWIEVVQPRRNGSLMGIDWMKDHHGTFPLSMLAEPGDD